MKVVNIVLEQCYKHPKVYKKTIKYTITQRFMNKQSKTNKSS